MYTKQSAFVFIGVFYSQIEGLRSPLSPLSCSIYIHYFEEKLLSVYKFPYWFRYVDDTFILVPSNTDFSSLLSVVNLIDCCIQSILEIENNNSLSFLDALVSKCIDQFTTTGFKKSFTVSLPPHVLFNKSPHQKIAAFYTYVYHALQI